MGGQACVFYGAAECSRDLDLLIEADETNLSRLRASLTELGGVRIAVPHLEQDSLRRGWPGKKPGNERPGAAYRLPLKQELEALRRGRR